MHGDFLGVFLDEAGDMLEEWESVCLTLEKTKQAEDFEALFRVAHNLKGSSRAVGLEEFPAFVHKVEDLITALKARLEITSFEIEVFLEAQALMSTWVEDLKDNPEFSPDQEKKNGILGKVEYRLIKREGSSSEKDSEAEIEPPQVADAAFGVFDDLPDSQSVEKSDAQSETLHQSQTAQQATTTKKKRKPNETIRISAERLDSLIQAVGELSIQHSIIQHNDAQNSQTNERVKRNAMKLAGDLIKEIQATSLNLRMQPLDMLFQRLERTATDVARAQKKTVEIITHGSGVELDKTVQEKITDPMIHILRNAVDHGIENDETRLQAGKSEPSKITITADQGPSQVRIIVKDNGRGLNAEKIKAKAIEKGLAQQSDKLTDKEIYNLIFLPGFSTASVITNVSGRGVGMDVVQRAVSDLGGSIDIDSKQGEGTEFIINLPTSLSIIDAFIIEQQNERFAAPIPDIHEIIDVNKYTTNEHGEGDDAGGMIELREEIIPLTRLSKFLELKGLVKASDEQTEMIPPTGKRHRTAFIVEQQKQKVAFEITDILHQQPIVIRPLSEQLKHVPGISGSTILSDGKPGLIVDLMTFAKDYFNEKKGAQHG